MKLIPFRQWLRIHGHDPRLTRAVTLQATDDPAFDDAPALPSLKSWNGFGSWKQSLKPKGLLKYLLETPVLKEL